MKPTTQDFYLLFCNHNFKKVSEIIQDGFSGMYFVLRIISDAKRELSAGDISDAFQVTTARTAVILSTLEKKRFISKSKSKDDARKTIVKLTESGKFALENRKNQIFDAINSIFSKLNEEELKSFYTILEKLFCD